MKLKNKIVFITGASAGIGAACAEAFAAEGARLLLCARRMDVLKALKARLQSEFNVDIHCFVLDVRKAKQVEEAIADLPPEWAGIDILVNNAGLALGLEKIQEGVIEHWDTMIDTNIKGLLYVSRFVVAGMIKRNAGMVINIGSISGHRVYSGGGVYCATKYAVRAITEALKLDVEGTPIRVSLVNPGLVDTEFLSVRFDGDQTKAQAMREKAKTTSLTPLDLADAVVFCATRPPYAYVHELTLMPLEKTSLPEGKK